MPPLCETSCRANESYSNKHNDEFTRQGNQSNFFTYCYPQNVIVQKGISANFFLTKIHLLCSPKKKEDIGTGTFKCERCGFASELWTKFCKKCGAKNNNPPPEDKTLVKQGFFFVYIVQRILHQPNFAFFSVRHLFPFCIFTQL